MDPGSYIILAIVNLIRERLMSHTNRLKKEIKKRKTKLTLKGPLKTNEDDDSSEFQLTEPHPP